MGQNAHPVPGGGAAVALTASAVLAVGLLVGGCSSPVSAQPTVLRQIADVTVVHTDGSVVAGSDGLRLQPGDVIRTGPSGRAALATAGRVVYVGSAAAVQVMDGARQSLRTGAVVVDALHGPYLNLSVGTVSVSTPGGAATRAERSVMVRIGSLAGSSRVTSSAGRELTVPALHQTYVGGDALPDSTTPLRLTDDDGEARTVPQLVRDDETLNGLARGIDATGRTTARVVTTALSWRVSAPPGVARADRLLPAIIAAAGSAGDAVRRYRAAVAYRQAGGSWAVVARLVGVPAAAVVTALARFERTQPPGRIGTVAQVLAGLAGPRTGTGSGGGSPATDGAGHRSGSGTGSGSGPGSGSGSSPTPSPSPSGGNGLVGVVDNTVGSVLALVPTPTPTPTPTKTPIVPLPKLPVPTVSLPALPLVP